MVSPVEYELSLIMRKLNVYECYHLVTFQANFEAIGLSAVYFLPKYISSLESCKTDSEICLKNFRI